VKLSYEGHFCHSNIMLRGNNAVQCEGSLERRHINYALHRSKMHTKTTHLYRERVEAKEPISGGSDITRPLSFFKEDVKWSRNFFISPHLLSNICSIRSPLLLESLCTF